MKQLDSVITEDSNAVKHTLGFGITAINSFNELKKIFNNSPKSVLILSSRNYQTRVVRDQVTGKNTMVPVIFTEIIEYNSADELYPLFSKYYCYTSNPNVAGVEGQFDIVISSKKRENKDEVKES